MRLRSLVKGLLTFVPGATHVLSEVGTGGTVSASYCYDVWLKHLTFLWANGVRSIPNSVGELGPGDSLGIGLGAVLSGANEYYALDVVRHSNPQRNLAIFDRLIALFQSRAARRSKGWPDYDGYLDEKLFPAHILTEARLRDSLSEKRLAAIRRALEDPDRPQRDGITIQYRVPWFDAGVIAPQSLDLILSHSVMEHVNDLAETYRALSIWLKPDGVMSHQIDFKSHGLTSAWNGHWTCPDWLWRMIIGKRAFLLNRQPRSIHVELIRQNGFEIFCDLKRIQRDGVERRKLATTWRSLSDDDFTCSGAFIQARKPPGVRSAAVGNRPHGGRIPLPGQLPGQR